MPSSFVQKFHNNYKKNVKINEYRYVGFVSMALMKPIFRLCKLKEKVHTT